MSSTSTTQPAPMHVFQTGAKRGSDHADCDLSLIPPEAIRAWGRAFAEGRKKYGTHNWLKGFPQLGVINHALQHIFSYLDGDTSEDHLGHAMWNIGVAIHQQKYRPDMIDLPPYETTRTDTEADEIEMQEYSPNNDRPVVASTATEKTAEELVKEFYPRAWAAGYEGHYYIEHDDRKSQTVYISRENCRTPEVAWESALALLRHKESLNAPLPSNAIQSPVPANPPTAF